MCTPFTTHVAKLQSTDSVVHRPRSQPWLPAAAAVLEKASAPCPQPTRSSRTSRGRAARTWTRRASCGRGAPTSRLWVARVPEGAGALWRFFWILAISLGSSRADAAVPRVNPFPAPGDGRTPPTRLSLLYSLPRPMTRFLAWGADRGGPPVTFLSVYPLPEIRS